MPIPLTPSSLPVAVEYLCARDADLARIVAETGPPPLGDRPPGFPTLVRIILEQNYMESGLSSIATNSFRQQTIQELLYTDYLTIKYEIY